MRPAARLAGQGGKERTRAAPSAPPRIDGNGHPDMSRPPGPSPIHGIFVPARPTAPTKAGANGTADDQTGTPQMSRAYSATVRSDENLPMRATFKIALRFHSSGVR